MINRSDFQNATIASYYWFLYTAFYNLQEKFPLLNIYFHQELNCHLGDSRFSKEDNEIRYKISDVVINSGLNYNMIVIMRNYQDYQLFGFSDTADKSTIYVELTLRFRDKVISDTTEIKTYVEYLNKQFELLTSSQLDFKLNSPFNGSNLVNWNIKCKNIEIMNNQTINTNVDSETIFGKINQFTRTIGDVDMIEEKYKKNNFLWVCLMTKYQFEAN